jgi:DNA-directed RNA polymerase specialized sigma24 family protein
MRRDRSPSRPDLTSELLEHLLERLSPRRREAAERYNRTRDRLVNFFSWQRCTDATDLADEVVNRVARRLAEGEDIPNLPGYFLGVARLVLLESRGRRAREARALGEYTLHQRAAGAAREEEHALECLERCLAGLDEARRDQLVAYYTGDQGERIARRKRLADSLGVGAIALRNRMLRMRRSLERCLEACMGRHGGRDESPDGNT